MFDRHFYKKANEIRDPLTGTENMAPFLYYMIRSIRPQNVLEYGMGYSTIFMLKALSDNIKAYEKEKKSILKKKANFPTPISLEDFKSFFLDKEAPLYDPEYYLKPYSPQLICFEKLPKSHEYTQNILKVVDDLNLGYLLTLIEGDACTQSEKIPSSFLPLDFVWNDDDSYYHFFKTYWGLLNNVNAHLLIHSTEGTGSLNLLEMEKIRQNLKNEENESNYEFMSILEPHKLHQRSFTIIRKKGNKEQIHLDIPNHQTRVYENFLVLKEKHKLSKRE